MEKSNISSYALKSLNPATPDEFYSQAARTSSFYYHTRLDTAIRILSGDKIVFFISPISNMNDENEKHLHEKEKTSTYILCFSHIRTESIPMWYLYSGITGEGARIGFTPARMKDILNSAIELYPVYGKKMNSSKPLHFGNDYSLEYGWVFYRNQADRSIKYRDENYKLFDTSNSFVKENYFIKDIEWSYEKEFRFVFRFNLNFYDLPDQLALVIDKKKMMLDDGLKVTLSPKFSSADINIVADQMNVPAILLSQSKINAKMDLLKRNQQSIIDHFPEVLSGLHMDELESVIKQAEYEIEKQQMEEPAYV